MRQQFAAGLFSFTLSLLFVGISTSSAHAYLDAGTGSMILQVLLGGVAGLAVAGKLYWNRFLTLIGAKRTAPEPADTKEKAPRVKVRADR